MTITKQKSQLFMTWFGHSFKAMSLKKNKKKTRPTIKITSTTTITTTTTFLGCNSIELKCNLTNSIKFSFLWGCAIQSYNGVKPNTSWVILVWIVTVNTTNPNPCISFVNQCVIMHVIPLRYFANISKIFSNNTHHQILQLPLWILISD